MFIKSRVFLPLLVGLLFVVGVSGVSDAAPKRDEVLMVIPSRHAIVQLGFDFAKIVPLKLIAYGTGMDGAMPVLHIWDKRLNDWVQIDSFLYRNGSLFDPLPKTVIIIGGTERIVNSIRSASAWGQDVRIIPTLDKVAVVNSVNEVLNFSPRAWRWIARRHELEIVDLNADRRRYGKYGKPGEKIDPPPDDEGLMIMDDVIPMATKNVSIEPEEEKGVGVARQEEVLLDIDEELAEDK